MFDDDILSTVPFQLEELSVSLEKENFRTRLSNLDLFLKSQSHTLEALSLNICMRDDIWKNVLSMPRLEELVIYDVKIFSKAGLRENHSITSLQVSNFCVLEYVSKYLPKLTTLRIPKISDEIVDLICENCKSLKLLSVPCFDVRSVENEAFFRSLEEFVSDKIIEEELFGKLGGKITKLSTIKFDSFDVINLFLFINLES